MKTPSEVVPQLGSDEELKVPQIVNEIEEWLRTHEEYLVNMNSTRGEVAEDVWHQVVAEAQAAGWPASITGAMVSIRRPR